MASIQLCTALANLVDGIDLGLFPSTFKYLETELHFTPAELGMLSMMGSLASCLSSVIWGCIADSYNRKRVFVVSTAMLGLMTLGTSRVDSFWSMAWMRIAAGFFVAAALPITQSLVAEAVPKNGLGVAFGTLAFASHLSGAGAAQLAARLSWRTAYRVMGTGTLGLSLFIWTFMPDVDAGVSRGASKLSLREWLNVEATKVRMVFQKRTFLALLAGGIVGCVPWNALSFSMMYFQSFGFSATDVGNMMALQGVGRAMGSYMGGYLGDVLAAKSPLHGRAFMAQITISFGMLVLLFPLYLLPWSTEYYNSYAASLFLFGFVSTWCNPGVDRPLWAELVHPDSRGTIVAWWTFIAGSFGSICGAPLVGWLAQAVLGYRPGGGQNTEALSEALLLCTMLPWALCFVAYSAIHCTYQFDVPQAKQKKVEQG
ncbi:unnamed protein product [Polarella glacialis]|uniref:Major facilitator superfamily (MFS) profile domain-containing protein n=1 Tax=Polarella glacialis TaxID=89957 RepID=A0A813GXQ3_POLGL|nr:unnamed protein product [Polarella glacialis]